MTNNKAMKILVTGGAGTIGSNLVQNLAREGYNITVADNLWRGKIANLYYGVEPVIDLKTNFLNLDLTDYKNCLEATKDVDMVIHLADIVAGINYVFDNQWTVFHKNMLINTNTLAAAIANNVEKYLYVGTACSYPMELQSEIGGRPLREEDAYPANPESSYGWSKLMGEYECTLAEREEKIQVAILRLHNVYGSPCEFDGVLSQVIPALCRKAICFPAEPFVVWGSGQQRRAFLFVSDVVDVIVRAMKNGFGKGVIQISPESSTSIKEISEQIVTFSGKDIAIEYDISKPEGDKDRVGDSTRASELLGWSPSVDLKTGLCKTYHWIEGQIISRNKSG